MARNLIRSIEIVKKTIIIKALATSFLVLTVLTQPALSAPPEEQILPDGLSAELPPIEAETFEVQVAKRSKSDRIYLIDLKDKTMAVPEVGRILLFRKEQKTENVMAFRVLKNYEEKNQFAVRYVRLYGERQLLDDGAVFLAIKKIGDIIELPPITPEEQIQDESDLKELEGEPGIPVKKPMPEVVPYDPELDTGTSPPSDDFLEEESDDGDQLISVDEIKPFDLDSHWLSAQFGYFRNTSSNGSFAYYSGGGARYALSVGKMTFLKNASIQDSLSTEVGIFVYKILNYSGENDVYTLLPFHLTLRYNIFFGPAIGIFFYGGVAKNFVISAVQATDDSLTKLRSTLPAGGGGLLFQLGPKWLVRLDLGIDMTGLGLVLRF